VQDGDLLIAITARTAAGTADSPPAGWTAAGNALGSAINWMSFYRIASSEPASYTFNANVTSNMAGVMLAYSGGGGAYVTSSTGVFTATANAVAPTVTTSTASDFVIAVTASKSVSATGWTPPSGYTDRANSANGTIVSVDASEKFYSTPGATGAQTTVMDRACSGLAALIVFTGGGVDVPVTGLAATGTLGGFSIVNGTNNSVNVTGLAGSGTLGAPKFEADYGATLDGTVQNAVRVGTTGLAGTGYPAGTIDRSTYISAGVCEVVPYGMPAFQGDAFQNDAFQTEVMAFPTTLTATGAVGSVIYQASYGFLAWGTSYGSGAGMRGDLGTLAQYHVDYLLTGVSGIGTLGTIVAGSGAGPTNVTVSGLTATGAVGSLAFHFDMNFTWPTVPRYGIIYPHGRVGVVALHYDMNFGVLGLTGTTRLGAIDPRVLYAVTGVQGAGHVGAVGTANSYRVTGQAAQGRLGVPVAGWVQSFTVTGVSGSTALNPPIVKNHQTFNGLSVAGAGGVGQVGFQISSTAALSGVQGLAALGVVGIVVDGVAHPTGLAAALALGHVTPMNMPRLDTHGTAAVGLVGIRVDCNVVLVGVHAAGAVGVPGETRSANTHVTGVEAVGILGVVAPAHRSAYDKRSDIFVRTQQ
jgi:hypothetical protein